MSGSGAGGGSSALRRDVVVVGGGPAGLAAAIAARRRGLEVALLEPRPAPIDKACGEGLMPDALAALSELGVDLGGAGQPFDGIWYVLGSLAASAPYPHGARGRGVARPELHAVLWRAAEAAGVELLAERAEGLAESGESGGAPVGVRTERGTVGARFVVGADGLRSKVRAWAGLASAREVPRGRERFGIRRHLELAATSGRVEVVFGHGAEAYLTPLAPDRTGVALLFAGETKGFDELLASRFPPELAARLAGARQLGRDLGAGPFDQRARSAVSRRGGRVALVGDAAGYVDAVTGEGLAIAFREALALAPALAAGDLARYRNASKRIRRVPEAITRLVVALARRPRLGARAVAALGRDPALFERLLGVLGLRLPAGSVGAGALLRFGWRVATGAGGAGAR